MGPPLTSGRARAYALLARLASAPSPRWLDAARADPRMAAAIASYPDPDELAADHQHVFGFVCPPFESALLDADGTLGGETSARVERSIADCGLGRGPGGEPPDHLATQLHALALLSGAEDDATEDGQGPIASGLRERQRAILHEHLLRWLPMLSLAVRRSERAWPTAFIDTVLDVALHHASELGPGASELVLPPLALSLEDAETGISEIARALARPARAGALVTRDDIARLGRATSTPRGFGDRTTLMENLLRAGASLGSLEDVLGSLAALLAGVRAELDDERFTDVPRALRAPWRARIDETCAVLDRMRARRP